jgi:hypothetical protein
LKIRARKKPVEVTAELCENTQVIKTLEGYMTAKQGDWIITGVDGERYPCKPGIFKKTYEIIEVIPQETRVADL